MLTVGLAVGLALMTRNPALLIAFIVIGGVGHGPFPQFSTQIWADYFGRAFLGQIRGLFSPPMVLAAAAGPLVAGRVLDLTGSYELLFGTYLGVLSVAFVCSYFAQPPRPPEQVATLEPDSACVRSKPALASIVAVREDAGLGGRRGTR